MRDYDYKMHWLARLIVGLFEAAVYMLTATVRSAWQLAVVMLRGIAAAARAVRARWRAARSKKVAPAVSPPSASPQRPAMSGQPTNMVPGGNNLRSIRYEGAGHAWIAFDAIDGVARRSLWIVNDDLLELAGRRRIVLPELPFDGTLAGERDVLVATNMEAMAKFESLVGLVKPQPGATKSSVRPADAPRDAAAPRQRGQKPVAPMTVPQFDMESVQPLARPTSTTGKVIECGPTTHRFRGEREDSETYKVVLRTEGGDKPLFGVDLARALEQGKVKVGDYAEIRKIGRVELPGDGRRRYMNVWEASKVDEGT
jgi:hypothetical protein